jgi:DnaJ-class molecular chaperone
MDPPDETNVECPECGGTGIGAVAEMEPGLCDRCSGEGYIDVKREAQDAREEMAERVAEDDFNRV